MPAPPKGESSNSSASQTRRRIVNHSNRECNQPPDACRILGWEAFNSPVDRFLELSEVEGPLREPRNQVRPLREHFVKFRHLASMVARFRRRAEGRKAVRTADFNIRKL